MDPELIEGVVARYFLALRDMNVEAWVETFAPDAISHDPVGAPAHQGRDAIRSFLARMLQLFDNVGLQEQQIFVAGDEAAVKWIGYGRGKNGRDVRFEGIDVISVNEQGMIRSVRAYWDPSPVIAQVTATVE